MTMWENKRKTSKNYQVIQILDLEMDESAIDFIETEKYHITELY
jgi:hypothetical protein